jgi:hypothetical protein
MPPLYQRLWRQRAVLWLVMSLGALSTAGCSLLPQTSVPRICEPAARTVLLNEQLDSWNPSTPFTLARASTAWLEVTILPFSAEGLFGGIGGIAEVHSIPSGSSPTVGTGPDGIKDSRDPAIIIQKALIWQQLSLKAGAWQIYSESNPGIEIISCPRAVS